MCQTSVWICKERAFWLVNRVIPLLTEEVRRYPVSDDSILDTWYEAASSHWTTICQGVPLVLVNRSGVIRHFYG